MAFMDMGAVDVVPVTIVLKLQPVIFDPGLVATVLAVIVLVAAMNLNLRFMGMAAMLMVVMAIVKVVHVVTMLLSNMATVFTMLVFMVLMLLVVGSRGK